MMVLRLLTAAGRCQAGIYRYISSNSCSKILYDSGPQGVQTTHRSYHDHISTLREFGKQNITTVTCRNLSSSSDHDERRKQFEKDPVFDTDEDENGPFRKIYSYPNIFVIKRMQWMKICATTLSGLSAPYILTLPGNTGHVALTSYSSAGSLLIVTSFLLYLGSIIQTNACRVYVNDETNEVKVSHMNFFANRKDVVRDISKVFIEPTQTPTIILLRTEGTKEKFRVYLNLCTPEEREEITKYFGNN